MYRFTILIFIALTLFTAPIVSGNNQVQSTQPEITEGKKAIVLGRVSDNPKKHMAQLQSIADYVASKLVSHGITHGKVVIAKDNRQLINLLKQGRVDWISETPFSATLYEDQSLAEIILLRWKKGVSRYRTIFITRKDSGIEKLEDLVGKKIAFEDPGSTSGFYVPAGLLLQEKLQLTELPSARDAAPEHVVGYIFSRAEMNISTLVFRRLVDAGTMSNLDWHESDRVHEKMKKELKIFYESQDIPRALELVRKDLDPSLKKALTSVLIEAHEDPEAEVALKNYKKTKRFEIIDKNLRSEIDTIRKLRLIVSEELVQF